jgi:hypothetical protein
LSISFLFYHHKGLFEIKIQILIDMWIDHESIGFGSTIRIVVGTQFLAWRYDMIPRVDYDHEWCISRMILGYESLSKWNRGHGIG